MDIVNNFDLQMFAEGGATSSGVSAGTGDGSTGNVGATGDSAVTTSRRKAKTDPFANVKFGIQEDASDPEAGSADDESTAAEGNAEDDISTNKDDSSAAEGEADGEGSVPKTYTEAEFKKALDREMKRRYKTNEKKMAPILRYASEALGVELGDIDAMSKAADTARKQRYQDEASLTGNDAAAIERNADNAYDAHNYREELNAIREQNEAEAFNARMAEQHEAVKTAYPEFDYDREIANPAFRTLLKAGFSMKNAYESVHQAEIQERIRSQALKEATEKVTASVAAGAARPTESGVSNSSAQMITDPSKLTKEQRAELKRRVARGERVVW